MTTAVIVQARTGSTRLPGKVLMSLGRHTVLEEVLDRCRRIPGADVVVCAIPEAAVDDVLIAPAERAGAVVVRGSETDVLGRYAKAAAAVGASTVMRVTSDCPLIDPQVCAEVLRLREREGADYASNALPSTFPHGLDCEAFTAAALTEAASKATVPYDREHVTPWLIRASHLKRSNYPSGDPSLARLRWTLDFPEDLAFLRAVFAALPPGGSAGMADVLAVIQRNPEIVEINAARNPRHREQSIAT
jgi:glutamate-1-semialdehyde 2,1-aminomutase/spore coat polysaccharide biosynthesis protein SpsF